MSLILREKEMVLIVHMSLWHEIFFYLILNFDRVEIVNFSPASSKKKEEEKKKEH